MDLLEAARRALELWDDLYSAAAYENGDRDEIAVYEAMRSVIVAEDGAREASEPAPCALSKERNV
jgi:hypothetical protein